MRNIKMKRLLSILLIALLSLFIISCGKNTKVNNAPVSETTTKETTSTETTKVSGDLKIHYIDVGQGDSELIQVGGKNILIDAGTSDKKALNYLKSIGVTTLDYIIATHPHEDHSATRF